MSRFQRLSRFQRPLAPGAIFYNVLDATDVIDAQAIAAASATGEASAEVSLELATELEQVGQVAQAAEVGADATVASYRIEEYMLETEAVGGVALVA